MSEALHYPNCCDDFDQVRYLEHQVQVVKAELESLLDGLPSVVSIEIAANADCVSTSKTIIVLTVLPSVSLLPGDYWFGALSYEDGAVILKVVKGRHLPTV